jgi:O-methyltransferase
MITCPNKSIGETVVDGKKIAFIESKIRDLNHVNGCVAEVGVYKGGSARAIVTFLDKRNMLYLFDTFIGIPNEDNNDNHFMIGDFYDTSFEAVQNLFKNNKNVIVYKGIFPQETGHHIKDIRFKFVHLDVDTYPSYMDSLKFFYDKMIVGGYIVFDDYNEEGCEGATKAVNEFFIGKEHIRNYMKSYYIIKE